MSKIDDVLNHMEETTYTFNVPLLSNKKEKIEFRPLKTKDQKLLAVEGADDNSKLENFIIMLKLLDGCIRKNKTPLETILLEDFYWLIINLRMKSLGNTLELFGTCEHCSKNKIPFVLDLEKDVEITYLNGIKDNELKISDKLTFFLKHICLEDMVEILKEEEDGNNEGMELSLAYMIDYVEFDGEVIDTNDTDTKMSLMNELSANQLKKFKEFLETNAFGIKVKKGFICTNEKCGKETKVELEGFDIIDFF